jgi:cytidine deaminase
MSLAPEPLLAAAAEAVRRAYCPYSGYAVGAAVAADDGAVFTGCNVENASYGLTLCAERAAVVAAVAAGRRKLTAAAVVTRAGEAVPSPCGACRQVLAEFCAPDCPVYAARADDLDGFQTYRLRDLLPAAFALGTKHQTTAADENGKTEDRQ